jgi:hypothetical protein
MRSDLDHCSLESCWLIALYISLKGFQLLRNPKALSPFAIAIAIAIANDSGFRSKGRALELIWRPASQASSLRA